MTNSNKRKKIIDTKWNMTNLEQAFLESATRYFRESQSKEIDLEQRRYDIAEDALAALLSNLDILPRALAVGVCQTIRTNGLLYLM